ncbi:dual OB domain-containing protein [Undibacterium sp. JH2W]|uniref:dual OB domain-containing protein n=1 Tax=Undibacterium sp. JH2W TaxID=3413037 RepID=UPI003BF2E291
MSSIKGACNDPSRDNPPRRRVRGEFSVLGIRHLVSVTDPEIEEYYLAQHNGDYIVGEAVLCISLVEPWNGYAFRVIASVITPNRFTT